jgi:hypothetical protein
MTVPARAGRPSNGRSAPSRCRWVIRRANVGPQPGEQLHHRRVRRRDHHRRHGTCCHSTTYGTSLKLGVLDVVDEELLPSLPVCFVSFELSSRVGAVTQFGFDETDFAIFDDDEVGFEISTRSARDRDSGICSFSDNDVTVRLELRSGESFTNSSADRPDVARITQACGVAGARPTRRCRRHSETLGVELGGTFQRLHLRR